MTVLVVMSASAEADDMRGSENSHEGASMNASTSTVELNGVELALHSWGPADGKPVLLMHALGKSGESWSGVAEALGASGYRLYALDQRGHGASTHTAEYTFELMRDDNRALFEHLELERAILIGHSMGGTVAYLFAQEWPESVECFVVEDTPPPRADASFDDLPEEPPAPVPYDWNAARAIIRELNNAPESWWERLASITAPALVVGGGSESMVDQDDVARAAERLPDAEFVTIEGAGHFVHETKPTEFIETVGDFLARRCPA